MITVLLHSSETQQELDVNQEVSEDTPSTLLELLLEEDNSVTIFSVSVDMIKLLCNGKRHEESSIHDLNSLIKYKNKIFNIIIL